MEQCKECRRECESVEFLLRHLRTHGMKAFEYVLKWEHNGIRPKCKCKCGRETGWNVAQRNFAQFLPGHCMTGTKRSDETRKKIGKTNAVNMVRYMQEHPDVVAARVTQLANGRTSEVYQRIAASVHKFWSTSSLAPELRKRASDRAVKLLSENKIGPQAPYKQENKFNPFTQQEERMHSSWESVFLDTCVEDKYPVTKDHKITIPYVDESGIERQYIPDFYAFEDRTLYEIKGFATERDLLKWEAAKLWCEQHGLQFAVLQEMT